MSSSAADLPAVLFRCDGGQADGLGHVMRCRTLAQAFKAAGVDVVRVLTHSPDGVGADKLREADLSVELSPAYAGEPDDRNATLNVARALSRSGRRTIMVGDSRRPDAAYWSACREAAFLVVVDDDAERQLDADVIVNPHVGVSEAAYQGLAVDTSALVLAGPTYNLIGPAYFGCSGRDSSDRLHVLITMGGEDPEDRTSWLLQELSGLLRDCDVTVVVGPAHPSPSTVAGTAASYAPHASILRNVADMRSLMVRADIALTAGGTTCYELAAMGVPQIGIVLEAHQRPLVDRLAECGCLMAAADYESDDGTTLRRVFSMVQGSQSRRTAMASAGRGLFDVSGAGRVVEAVLRRYAVAVKAQPESLSAGNTMAGA